MFAGLLDPSRLSFPAVSTDHRTIDWILRIGVALECAAYAWLVGYVLESPLLAWLWEPTDVGGLGLGEAAALPIVRIVGVVFALAAISTLTRPSRILLIAAGLLQLAIAVAAWQTYEGFPVDIRWLGTGALRSIASSVVPLFPFAASAARIAAPFALLLVHWSRFRALLGIAVTPTCERLIRVALALTFAAHGVEALQHRGSFVDMLITASGNLLSMRMTESLATGLLIAIGVIDLVLAVLVLVRRWRQVALYMAAWGLITASARLVVLRWDVGWYEFAIRAPHWALPLVLYYAWRLAPRPAKQVE